MAFIPPPEVTRLQSFAEVISWVVGAYAPGEGRGSLDEVSRIRQVQNLRSANLSRGTIHYGGSGDEPRVPGHLHVAWFLRIGASGTRDLDTIPRNNLFNSLAVGSKDYFDDESFYHLDYLTAGVPIPREVAEWLEADAATFGKTLQIAGVLQFNPTRVDAAIKAIKEPEPAEAQPSPSEEDLPPKPHHRALLAVNGAPTGPPTSVTVVLRGRQTYVRQTRTKLELVSTGSTLQRALIATDGSLLATQEGTTLRVARVNRASGQTAAWANPIDLSVLGEGAVLAIDGAGSADIMLVWASDDRTATYLGRHKDGSVELIEELEPQPASAAVLHGVRALLLFPDNQTGEGTCEAFGDLIVKSMVGAASNGRLVVLAVGTDRDGQEGAWIEADGRHRQKVPADSRLELPLGTRSFPILRGADDRAIEVSPQPTTGRPYEHWMSPLLIGEARNWVE